MKLSRSSRVATALFALFCLLNMQFAMATYVCPVNSNSPEMAVLSMAQGPARAGCDNMDQSKPVLCHAHCQEGQQSLDKPDLPSIACFIAVGFAVALQPITADFLSLANPTQMLLARSTAPPIAIRHCCFRI